MHLGRQYGTRMSSADDTSPNAGWLRPDHDGCNLSFTEGDRLLIKCPPLPELTITARKCEALEKSGYEQTRWRSGASQDQGGAPCFLFNRTLRHMLSFTYERPKARLRLLIKSVAPPRATSLGVPRGLLEGRMRSLVARLVLAGVEENALVCAPHVLGIRTPHGRHLNHHGSQPTVSEADPQTVAHPGKPVPRISPCLLIEWTCWLVSPPAVR